LMRALWSRLSLSERVRFGAKRLFLFVMLRLVPAVGKRLWGRYGAFPSFDPRKREVQYRSILELFESYEKMRA